MASTPRTARVTFSLVTLFLLASLAVLTWGVAFHLWTYDEFVPRRYSFLNKRDLIFLHVLPDLVIGLSLASMAAGLCRLVNQGSRDLPFSWLMGAFAALLASCGATYFLDALTIWFPRYWLQGNVKLLAMAAAGSTAILFPSIVSRVLAMLKVARLANLHRRDLENEVLRRKSLEGELKHNRDELEHRVRDRTAEIQRLNSHLEDMVAERTTQLESALKELESFSYSVSHDLMAPLRAIDGFSNVLMTHHQAQFDEEATALLGRIRGNVARMEQLTTDMLQLSRITRQPMQRETVDLSLMSASIMGAIEAADPAREITFLVDENITADGDPALLRILLENLYNNAWKFTSKVPRGVIRFGVQMDRGFKHFFVQDNGAGFDMHFADKLFGAFQRLHSQAEFPGTGIGLATAQRCVHRHGGVIWAEGVPGKGATFYFTLETGAKI